MMSLITFRRSMRQAQLNHKRAKGLGGERAPNARTKMRAATRLFADEHATERLFVFALAWFESEWRWRDVTLAGWAAAHSGSLPEWGNPLTPSYSQE